MSHVFTPMIHSILMWALALIVTSFDTAITYIIVNWMATVRFITRFIIYFTRLIPSLPPDELLEWLTSLLYLSGTRVFSLYWNVWAISKSLSNLRSFSEQHLRFISISLHLSRIWSLIWLHQHQTHNTLLLVSNGLHTANYMSKISSPDGINPIENLAFNKIRWWHVWSLLLLLWKWSETRMWNTHRKPQVSD